MTHKDLEVYKLSMLLVKEIYQSTRTFPKSEIYGLTSQMRRASISIPSNISEGAARHSNKDYIHFLNISLGSVSELETQIEISAMLNFIDDKQIESDLIETITRIRQMLLMLIKSLS